MSHSSQQLFNVHVQQFGEHVLAMAPLTFGILQGTFQITEATDETYGFDNTWMVRPITANLTCQEQVAVQIANDLFTSASRISNAVLRQRPGIIGPWITQNTGFGREISEDSGDESDPADTFKYAEDIMMEKPYVFRLHSPFA